MYVEYVEISVANPGPEILIKPGLTTALSPSRDTLADSMLQIRLGITNMCILSVNDNFNSSISLWNALRVVFKNRFTPILLDRCPVCVVFEKVSFSVPLENIH